MSIMENRDLITNPEFICGLLIGLMFSVPSIWGFLRLVYCRFCVHRKDEKEKQEHAKMRAQYRLDEDWSVYRHITTNRMYCPKCLAKVPPIESPLIKYDSPDSKKNYHCPQCDFETFA